MKQCSKCKVTQPVTNFYPAKKSPDGLQSWCRACSSEYAKSRPKRKRLPEDNRRQHLMYNYGITPEEYDSMLQKQGGTCATCSAVPGRSTRKFHVDHDHSCCPGKRSCGKCVRGILCVNCNAALGMVNDDAKLLENLRNYVLMTVYS